MTAHHTPRHRAAGAEGFGRSPWPSQPIAVIPSPRRPADDVVGPAAGVPLAERPTVLTMPAPLAATDLGRFAADAAPVRRGSDGTVRLVAGVLVLTALLAASIVLVVLTLAGHHADPAPVAPDRVVPAAAVTPPVGAATAAPGAGPVPVLGHAPATPGFAAA